MWVWVAPALAVPPVLPDWQVSGGAPGQLLGESLAAAGDLDGDGIADLAVGAPAAGRVSVFLGGPAGLGAAPVAVLTSGPFDRFGGVICAAGDVDGDGDGELVVGAPALTTSYQAEGGAALFPGGPGGPAAAPSWRFSPRVAFGRFPDDCAGLDLNGDGYSDLVLGAVDTAPNAQGELFVFLGGPAGLGPSPDQVIRGGDRDGLGGRLAPAGDANGDGYPDLLVGAPVATGGEQMEGRATLWLGGPGGLSAAPSWSFEPDQVLATLGTVAGLGDVDGDGYDDVAVGALAETDTVPQEGVVRVFLGGPGGLSATPSFTRTSGQERGWLGQSLAGGDFDGDGFADLLVSSGGWDGAFVEEGRVELHRGGPGGLDPVPAWTVTGGQYAAYFGYRVAAADFTGDGLVDPAVGAYGHATFAGAAFAWWSLPAPPPPHTGGPTGDTGLPPTGDTAAPPAPTGDTAPPAHTGAPEAPAPPDDPDDGCGGCATGGGAAGALWPLALLALRRRAVSPGGPLGPLVRWLPAPRGAPPVGRG